MSEMLETPEEDKVLKPYDTDHILPKNESVEASYIGGGEFNLPLEIRREKLYRS